MLATMTGREVLEAPIPALTTMRLDRIMASKALSQTIEHWLPIPEWEGLYEVSDLGRVRSLARHVPFYSARGRRWTTKRVCERVLKPGMIVGYPAVELWHRNKHQRWLVHRLVCHVFIGPSDGLEVAHLNSDRGDPRLINLIYADRAENFSHKMDHGTFGWKLSRAQVNEIRSRKGESVHEIAQEFGLSAGHVYAIWSRKCWKDA